MKHWPPFPSQRDILPEWTVRLLWKIIERHKKTKKKEEKLCYYLIQSVGIPSCQLCWTDPNEEPKTKSKFWPALEASCDLVCMTSLAAILAWRMAYFFCLLPRCSIISFFRPDGRFFHITDKASATS